MFACFIFYLYRPKSTKAQAALLMNPHPGGVLNDQQNIKKSLNHLHTIYMAQSYIKNADQLLIFLDT